MRRLAMMPSCASSWWKKPPLTVMCPWADSEGNIGKWMCLKRTQRPTHDPCSLSSLVSMPRVFDWSKRGTLGVNPYHLWRFSFLRDSHAWVSWDKLTYIHIIFVVLLLSRLSDSELMSKDSQIHSLGQEFTAFTTPSLLGFCTTSLTFLCCGKIECSTASETFKNLLRSSLLFRTTHQ